MGRKLGQCLGQGRNCFGWHQQPGLPRHHLFAWAANIGGNNRQAGQHRLNHTHRQALKMRWQAEDIRCCQQPRHIMPIAKPLQAGAERRGGAGEMRFHILAMVGS